MNESIETVLNSFLMEMYKWEDNANKHIDAGTDIPDEMLKQTLKEIYDKYLQLPHGENQYYQKEFTCRYSYKNPYSVGY
mgnify:CR=1 FL=1